MADQSKQRGFTPGPWTVYHRCSGCTGNDDERLGLGLEVVGPEPASLRGDYARAADARVLAASKDLYEALRRIREDARITGLDQKAGWDAWFAMADAALAKAEGRDTGGDDEG